MIKERAFYRNEAKIIIVVEDDDCNREMFELVIASETPYHPLVFPDGQALLQSLDEIKTLKPSLFLLDYHLPSTTAFDLYDHLRQIEDFKEVPTIIVTADPTQQIEDAATRLHLALLAKPFEMDQLLTMFKHVVG